jgi:hypothetical protein
MSSVGFAAGGVLARLSAALPVDPCALSDGQLIGFVQTLAEARRQLEALELAAAGALEERSGADAPDSLARRMGFKTAAAAIQSVTGSSGKEAGRLVTDAKALAKVPAVEAAVLDGRIGREAASAIAGQLGKLGPEADQTQVLQIQDELVNLATTAGVDEVKQRTSEKVAALSVRVVADQAKKAMAERFFWIGPVIDGSAKLRGSLPAGYVAVVNGVLDAFVNPKGKVAFTDPDEPEQPKDERTTGQKKADVLRDICAAQARAANTPEMGGDHPTVWLSTTVAELESGEGLAFYAGSSEPVPVAEAEQAACAGGIQTVIFDERGDVLRLGREVRGFTKRQRRAIALRDGGTCLIPGCTIPAQWCEAHHVVPYRDGGDTDVCNGVLLCWFHHHEIDSGPWQIRMTAGTPEIRYAWDGRTDHWKPVGDGAAAKLKAKAPPG